MPNPGQRKRVKKPRDIALIPPRTTVLTDHALSHEEADSDSFQLAYRLGPVLDILRHPDTRTPMAIAVYGGWGTGKTSGMRWLHGKLDKWNREGEDKRKITVKPVWFYPWKYHEREDVWRGLIAEVIINSIDVETATVGTVTNAAKRFGMFLGRSFVHALAGLKLRARAPGEVAEAELSLGAIRDILSEYHEAAHPEHAYLNDFEAALQGWIKDTLRDNERMVIFIDDLDRCMPDVGLEVLEALKLYLNIEKLIFVVGVDRSVVEELVKGYYTRLGLRDDKSGNYLAKMFQVEVELAPREQQIEGFLDEQLRQVGEWQTELEPDDRQIFRGVIFKLAERNPREVKRLINSALMLGAGFSAVEPGGDPHLEFRQGMQLFFVRKILEDRYTRGLLVGSERGDWFFRQWSEIVASYKADEKFPQTLHVPEAFIEQQKGTAGRPGAAPDDADASGVRTRESRIDPASFAQKGYLDFVSDKSFADLLHLLGDTDLGDLMQIPYPAETTAVGAAMGAPEDIDLVREAVARELGKKPEEVRDEDYPSVTRLNLSGSELSDLKPLEGLENLRALSFSETQVSDLKPLQGLKNLQELYLDGTRVSDLKPLEGLTNLRDLSLDGTQVSDLKPLEGLTGPAGALPRRNPGNGPEAA